MQTLSHYDILAKLGEGGMGVVWKARDRKLDRIVALKVLPAEKTADPERRRRFVQEARAASALHHPAIVTIFEIDHADNVDFIAMEFVEGKTLDRLIPPKGMKVSDAVKVAMQIAEALAAAHAAGIVHRDLKPGNVMVTDAGQVKVLDFGLAKLMEDSGVSEFENTRTIAEQAKTAEGTIVGTVSYMSPEQAEGKKVDARSDIFSFGSLLYEMLTGRRPFHGESNVSTLASILRTDPEPIDKLTTDVPRELTRIVQRCLRKNTEDRAQSMADLRVSLKEIKEESESGAAISALPPVAAPRSLRARAWAAAGLALVVAAFVAYRVGPWRTLPEIALKAEYLTSYAGAESYPTFSPDGTQVAFSWNGEASDNYDIYVKVTGPGKPLRLTTDPLPDISPSWSPDGRSIAFLRGTSLLLISPLGGTEREVAHFTSGEAGFTGNNSNQLGRILDWSPDGHWLVTSLREAAGEAGSLFLISVETGEKRRLTSPSIHVLGDFDGAISPDGRFVAWSRNNASASPVMAESDIYVMPLGSGYSPAGAPVRITSDSLYIGGLAWTADSREIVFSSLRAGIPALWRVAAAVSQKPIRLGVGDDAIRPAVSRQGNRLAFEHTVPADINLWRVNLTDPSQAQMELAASTRVDQSARYSPDGKKIVFSSERAGPSAIWVSDADGGNLEQLTMTGNSGSPSWSPDGQRIAFDSLTQGQWQVFTMSARGGARQPLTVGPQSHTRPFWSHDGRWIYVAGSGGIQKVPAAGGDPVQLAPRGNNPVETEDGTSVIYWNNVALWKVSVNGGPETRLLDEQVSALGEATVRDGIYYFTPAPNRTLRFFSFATGHSREILKIPQPLQLGLSISPDGNSLLYSRVDTRAADDLMLVDPFR